MELTGELCDINPFLASYPPVQEIPVARFCPVWTDQTEWDEATYNSIDWRHHGEVLKKLSNGRRIQISKYINDLLPTKQRLATFDMYEGIPLVTC
jgi:hypothetical protein